MTDIYFIFTLINTFLNLMKPIYDKINEIRDRAEKNELFSQLFISDIEKIESLLTEIIGRTVKITLIKLARLGNVDYEDEKLKKNIDEVMSRLRELRKRMLEHEELVKTVLGENDWIKLKNYIEVFGKEKIDVEELIKATNLFINYKPSTREKETKEETNKLNETIKKHFTNVEFLEDLARKKVIDSIDCITKCLGESKNNRKN